MKKKYLILLSIILLAAFLRFYGLGQNPPSLTWDEVAWGYNAYSLGIDGRDEHGRFLPLDYLESFGDFKPPVYAYLDIIPIKIFGLNEFAVRFPSAFFGTLTVVATYFLVKRIFKRHEEPFNMIALLSMFILAISPWHINLSRAAFEANVSTFFIVTGVWLFLKSVQDRMWFLPLSVICFVLSIYTFNTGRIVSPILLIVLSLIFLKHLFRHKKQVVVSILIGIFLILPVVRFLFSPLASLRFEEVNIFTDIRPILMTNQEIENNQNALWSRIIHNRRFAYTAEYMSHYFDHFKPGFLFINGDGNPKFSTQEIGSMYLWDLPFFMLGILFLFRHRIGYWWIVPLWMLIGISPAATARETPHALRIESALPTFQIFTAYGFFVFLNKISNIKNQISRIQIKYLIFALSILFLFFNFIYYLRGYYAHYPYVYSGEWQFGYKEAIGYIKDHRYKYDNVYITEALGRPYIYALFYLQYDPGRFREQAIIEREALGFVHVKGFDQFRFANNIRDLPKQNKDILYIDTEANVPRDAMILKTFYLLNGKPSLVAFTK
ncbi:MAG: hypothetical protein A2687_01535 [Candidatus Levybacteria bacterium RIFCSPHIGHO2_01_FULL_38_26]|nr:MAG: hypothetical protein A2687_01535 [Candidatus Levybacteria bacterium RIFCSPHIGHO2_01_FULL_38_26]